MSADSKVGNQLEVAIAQIIMPTDRMDFYLFCYEFSYDTLLV